jgi:hypothetical protein
MRWNVADLTRIDVHLTKRRGDRIVEGEEVWKRVREEADVVWGRRGKMLEVVGDG